MFFESLLVQGLLGSAIGLVTPTAGYSIKKRADLSSFISSEVPVAYQGTLNNIGPEGSGAPGASAGIVVASPSQTNPDCTLTPIH